MRGSFFPISKEIRVLRAVLWDLDGTLFDRHSSVRRLIGRQYDAYAAALAPIQRHSFTERFMQLDQRGYVPKPAVYRALLEEFGVTTVTPDELFAYWQAHYHDRCMLYPRARETLERLRGAGIALGMISNGGFPWQLRTIQACGIEHYFDAILVSEAEGLRKPDPAIFELALRRLGVAAGESVFVGDHPLVDIAGARNAGLSAFWKRDPYWEPPAGVDGIIDDLGALSELILAWYSRRTQE